MTLQGYYGIAGPGGFYFYQYRDPSSNEERSIWYPIKSGGFTRACASSADGWMSLLSLDTTTSTVDSVSAAQTTNGTQTPLGLMFSAGDEVGAAKQFAYYGAAETKGFFRLMRGDVYMVAVEDAIGGSMGVVTTGSVPMAPHDPSNVIFQTSRFGINPQPVLADLLDSSNYSATPDHHAFNIIGTLASVVNDGGPSTPPILAYVIQLSASWRAIS